MIKITQLTMRNFLSVGNVTQAIRLDEDGITLLLGQNADTNSNNGAGKTSIIQAMSYVIYGKPISKIKIPNLVNNINQKGMAVTIEFERDDQVYRIERGKKPDFLRFYVGGREFKNDAKDEAQGENRQTQVEIERVFGLSHSLFQHLVGLNTMTEAFLKMRAGDQKEIIEELLLISQISMRGESLKVLIGKTKELLRDENAAIRANQQANDRLEIAIQAAQAKVTEWDTRHSVRKDKILADLSAAMAFDFDAEFAAHDAMERHQADIKALNESMTRIGGELNLLEKSERSLKADVARLTQELAKEAATSRLEADQRRSQSNRERHETLLANLMASREAAIKDIESADQSDCVCCGQALAGTQHLETVRKNLEASLAEIEGNIARENETIATHWREYGEIADEIIATEKAHGDRKAEIELELAKAVAQLKEIEAPMAALVKEYDDLASQTPQQPPRPICGSRDEVYGLKQAVADLEKDLAVESTLINPHLAEVASLKSTIREIDYQKSKDLEEMLAHQDFLHRLLSNKDSFIRKRLIDQNLSYLNSRMSHYLDKLGLPHVVNFQSDLSVEITNLGRDLDFEQLSRGEMNRVIMATSLSFRDIWESTSVGCNLLWVDELLDVGLCPHGVETALGVLKGFARDRGKNVFLISHRDELKTRTDRALIVRKENGFTQVEYDGL